MTERKKPVRIPWGSPGSKVKRVTDATLRSGKKSRKVVVSIYPDGTVGYRLLGERSEYYRNAVADYAEAAYLTKRAEKARRRAERKGR